MAFVELNEPPEMWGPLGEYVVPFALLPAGVCRIFNNAAKDIDERLPGWNDWLADLKLVADLFHKKHPR
eukprot:11154969-Lingulodinium_polyedra.AAC.1